ncbi:hypothetical protein [Prosthecobacter dejongeii]|uniref:Winged helix-turn helix n=1 Tax=Prosthecobacter dejongeii TaxID=48465 RepID=A0A7W7YP10_9BACT|nr:hypothetical protein [Prosthecobacter dejongeii]MBB5039495.1 hypothetical protein [Prosthecobacter dejongeii]
MLKEQLQVELGYNTVIRHLHDLDFNPQLPRKWPLPLLDEPEHGARHQAFEVKIKSQAQDLGVEGDPRPRRRRMQPGSKPKVPHLGEHLRRSVVGAVCPASGESFHLVFDGFDSAVFKCWLNELAKSVPL